MFRICPRTGWIYGKIRILAVRRLSSCTKVHVVKLSLTKIYLTDQVNSAYGERSYVAALCSNLPPYLLVALVTRFSTAELEAVWYNAHVCSIFLVHHPAGHSYLAFTTPVAIATHVKEVFAYGYDSTYSRCDHGCQ